MPNISKIILIAILTCATGDEIALADQSVAAYRAPGEERANSSVGSRFGQSLPAARLPAARQNEAVRPASEKIPRATTMVARSSPTVRVTQRKKRLTRSQSSDGWSSLANTALSLAVVLGLLFAVVWVMRRTAPHSARTLPTEVFEILGRSPLSDRQQVHLVRCGNKLLLVSVTPTGAETLTEITDAEQVDRLSGLCARDETQSATNVFRSVLQQFSREPATSGFLGNRPQGTIALASARESPGPEGADG